MKFKVGNRVRCIENKKISAWRKGSGWKLNHEFTITEITNQDSISDPPVYWKGSNGFGVFEDCLELAIKEEIIYE